LQTSSRGLTEANAREVGKVVGMLRPAQQISLSRFLMSELTDLQERLTQLEKQVHQGKRIVAVSVILGALA
jgi:hypothetical protein